MHRLDTRARLLAITLSCLAGLVDAIGFLEIGGLFVSFMTGNSTRLGISIAQWSSEAILALGLIVSFVTGVTTGSVLGGPSGAARQSRVLAVVAILLTMAAVFGSLGASTVTALTLAVAMGAVNAVFETDGEVKVGVTYMTGTLVRLGQKLASAIRGEGPKDVSFSLMLWLGLVAGVVTGALAYAWLSATSLWLAAASAAGLAVVTRMHFWST